MLFVINRSNNGSEKNLQEVSKSFSNSQLVFQNVKVGPWWWKKNFIIFYIPCIILHLQTYVMRFMSDLLVAVISSNPNFEYDLLSIFFCQPGVGCSHSQKGSPLHMLPDLYPLDQLGQHIYKRIPSVLFTASSNLKRRIDHQSFFIYKLTHIGRLIWPASCMLYKSNT